MSSSAHINNKGKDILILGEGPAQGLDNATLTAEKKYWINFTENGKNLSFSLHYNGANSCLFGNSAKIIKFKAKDYVYYNNWIYWIKCGKCNSSKMFFKE